MLEKGKKYTYDDLKKIIKEVERKVVAKLDNDMKDVINDEKRDYISSMMFSMQNILVASMMSQMLLEKEEE